jgi:hypothetical protein
MAYGVALVDTAGRWWRGTRPQGLLGKTPLCEDTEQAARMVANYLGIPFLPPYETPPGGVILPPLNVARRSRIGDLDVLRPRNCCYPLC